MPPADPRPVLGAIAVVVEDNRVLLVKRTKDPDAGLWGFPGGHVEWGETALDAAARELQEETGVIASPVAYLTNIDVVIPGPNGRTKTHYLLAAVLCTDPVGTPVPADDVSGAAWFSCDDVKAHTLQMSDQVPELMELGRAVRARLDPRRSTTSAETR